MLNDVVVCFCFKQKEVIKMGLEKIGEASLLLLSCDVSYVLDRKKEILSGRLTQPEVVELKVSFNRFANQLMLIVNIRPYEKFRIRCLSVRDRIFQDFLNWQSGILAGDLGVRVIDQCKVVGAANSKQIDHFFWLCDELQAELDRLSQGRKT